MTDRAVMSVISSSGWPEAGGGTQLSAVVHNAFFFWPEKVSDRFALCEREVRMMGGKQPGIYFEDFVQMKVGGGGDSSVSYKQVERG